MKQTHSFLQGSPEWATHRSKYFNASDASAAMGISRYKSRGKLIQEIATGITVEYDDATLARFSKGHEFEAIARPWAEEIIGTDLYPIVMSNEIDGLSLSASFDGIDMAEEVTWEHKTGNKSLLASLEAGEIPYEYKPQIEQGLLISGAKRCLFMASSGEKETMRFVWYESDLKVRAVLIAAWHQFHRDLAEYVPQEIIPAAVATPQAQLPAVSVQVLGSIEVRDNLTAFGDALRAYVERINRKPETDQDFADLEASCKTLKEAETALDAAENSALGQAASIDQMRRIVAESRELARTTRLTIEKLVDAEKKNRREKIVTEAGEFLRKFIVELNARVKFMPEIQADFGGAIKGKKTLASIKNSVDTELARAKTEASMIADMIDANLKVYGELASGYDASFADLGKIVNQPPEACRAIIEQRIAQQKAQDEARRAAEEERIRAEERAKIEREQAEQRRIAGLWVEAMIEAVAEDQRISGIAAAEKIKLDAVKSSSTFAPAHAVWQKSRDDVAAMLEDMTITELSLARIALAKIRNERTQRAA